MGKLKFSIHPTFLIFAIVLIYFGKGLLFLTYLLVLFIHELSHAIVAKKMGYKLNNIKLIPFGICLNLNSDYIKPKDEIIIALAGPFVNLLLSIILVCLWWFVPSFYNITNVFCYANLITCLFNLIPAFPLDGGRVLHAILKENFSTKKALKLTKITNIIVSIILIFLFILSCFYQINLTYILVVICVLSGVFERNEKQYYTVAIIGFRKKIGKIVKIKSLYVSENEKIFKLLKYVDSFSYLQIFLYDNSKNVVAKLFETEFLTLLEKNPINFTFKQALKLY